MRKKIAEFIEKDEYLIHSDIFNTKKFPTRGIEINCGLGERNALNIAGGLASQGKTVWIYGVGIFVYYRLEQLKFICKDFGAKRGKIIIFNAGKIGYEDLGSAHKVDDDEKIMNLLNINYFSPNSLNELETILSTIKNKKVGMFYIQLGKDY